MKYTSLILKCFKVYNSLLYIFFIVSAVWLIEDKFLIFFLKNKSFFTEFLRYYNAFSGLFIINIFSGLFIIKYRVYNKNKRDSFNLTIFSYNKIIRILMISLLVWVGMWFFAILDYISTRFVFLVGFHTGFDGIDGTILFITACIFNILKILLWCSYIWLWSYSLYIGYNNYSVFNILKSSMIKFRHSKKFSIFLIIIIIMCLNGLINELFYKVNIKIVVVINIYFLIFLVYLTISYFIEETINTAFVNE